MIRKLSSIKFAFYNLVFLAFLMGAGVYLSLGHKQDVNMMNETLIVEWLADAWSQTPVLAVWFVLLCLNAASLLVNALCCSLTKQVRTAVRSGRPEKWLFFVLHCLFIAVLACHGLILVVGHKQADLILFSKGKIQFKDRYAVEVTDIVFIDDIRMLKAGKNEQRSMMTRQNVHREQNFALVSLYQASTLVKTQKVMMLSPLRYGPVQVTLTEFIVDGTQDRKDRIGVKLTLTENRLNFFFFTIYALMILTLGLYILMAFRSERV